MALPWSRTQCTRLGSRRYRRPQASQAVAITSKAQTKASLSAGDASRVRSYSEAALKWQHKAVSYQKRAMFAQADLAMSKRLEDDAQAFISDAVRLFSFVQQTSEHALVVHAEASITALKQGTK